MSYFCPFCKHFSHNDLKESSLPFKCDLYGSDYEVPECEDYDGMMSPIAIKELVGQIWGERGERGE